MPEDGLSPSLRETVDLYDGLLSGSATVEPSYAAQVINPIKSTLNLREKHPDMYTFFKTGHYVLRRIIRYRASLLRGRVIEQVLTRSVKATCDMTRSQGKTESGRSQ